VLALECLAAISALRFGWRAPFAIGFAVSSLIYEIGGGGGRLAGMSTNIVAAYVFEHGFALVFGFLGGSITHWWVRSARLKVALAENAHS
jgi:hypothetical protein